MNLENDQTFFPSLSDRNLEPLTLNGASSNLQSDRANETDPLYLAVNLGTTPEVGGLELAYSQEEIFSNPDASEILTPRQTEVATLIASGLTNGEIAERLCLTLGSVKGHVHNIFERLNVLLLENNVSIDEVNRYNLEDALAAATAVVQGQDLTPPIPASPPTYRQQQYLELRAQGLTYGQIAEQLGVTPGTVKQTFHNIRRSQLNLE